MGYNVGIVRMNLQSLPLVFVSCRSLIVAALHHGRVPVLTM